MARVLEKVILSVLFVLFLGFNSFFIFGQQHTIVAQENAPVEKATLDVFLQDITEEQAREIALSVASGTITEVKEKTSKGMTFYAVEIENNDVEIEVKINKENGDILQVIREANDAEEDDETVSPTQLQTISGVLTEEQAKAIALAEVGGIVTGFAAEREGGRLLYEVELEAQGDTAEVEIDAETGEILEIEWGEDEED